ncbi:MAG TPA: DNA repair protein RadC [Chryseosolibacter sp.]
MEINEPKPLNIKDWSPEDRPREKLLSKGSNSLSDAELIAILLGSGTTKLSAVELAKFILAKVDNNLNNLARLTTKDLMKIKGIGEAKAVTIIAAMELGRRRKEIDHQERAKVSGSKEIFELMRSYFLDLPHEEFWVILLNRGNRIIRKQQISHGGVAGTVADPKIIFKAALEELACGIILAHNHPSGNVTPSQQDIDLTKKIKESGKLMEIQVLDHLIFAGSKYYSFADEGLL